MNRRRVLALALLEGEMELQEHQEKRRGIWVHETLQNRKEQGDYWGLVQELRFDDERFRMYFRVTREQFDELLTIVGPTISKETTNYREPIAPAERLSICLR